MFSEEIDWLTRFRRAGWQVWFYPDAEVVHVGGASHGGRLYVENLRGQPALLRQAPRARGGRAAAAAAARRAPPARCSSCGDRSIARACASSRSGDVQSLLRVIVYLRLAFGDAAASLLPGWARRARARAAQRARRCSPGRWRRSSSRGPRCSRCHRSIHLAVAVLAVIFVGRAGRRGAGTNLVRDEPRARVRGSGSGLGVVLGLVALARRGRRHRRRPLPRGARPQARRPDVTCTCARSTSSRTAGCIPATRSRSGTSSSRSSRGSRASIPASSSATSRRCSCRSPAPSRGRPASPSSARAAAGVVAADACRSRSSASGRDTAARGRRSSLPGTAARQLLVPAAIALFFTRTRRLAAARGDLRRARARRTRRTRSSCSCRSTLYALLRVDEWRRSAPLLAAALVPTGSRCSG